MEICAPEMAAALLRRTRLKSNFGMDIWALGCCLYQMVTSRLLVNDAMKVLVPGESFDIYAADQNEGLKAVAGITQAAVDQVLHDVSDRLESVKLVKQAASVLRHMLQVDPQKRTTIEGILT